MDLSKVANRAKLKPRREPYWQRVAVGQFLGFRPSAVGAGGAWIARHYDREAGLQRHHALGDFGHLPANERHAAAVKAAQEWLEHVALGGTHKVQTVAEACRAYAASRHDAEARFKRQVYAHRIARIPLHKLT